MSDKLDLSSIKNKNSSDFVSFEVKKRKGEAKPKETPKPEKAPEVYDDAFMEDLRRRATLPMDDMQYKKNLIKKIERYKEVFEKFLTKINMDGLEYKSQEALEDILIEIKEAVANRTIGSGVNNLIQTIPFGIEKFGTSLGADLEGYGRLINSNPEYYYTVQEMLIENDIIDKIRVAPHYRLAFMLGRSALMVHTVNQMKKAETYTKFSQSAEDLKEKFSGI